MNVLIIGCGRLGGSLAKELSNCDLNVTIVDRDSSNLEKLGSGFNGEKVRGIEYDHDILKAAGIETADIVLAMTPNENINITVSLIAKEIYKSKRVIARVVYPESEKIYKSLGISTINQTLSTVNLIMSKIGLCESLVLDKLDEKYEIINTVKESNDNMTVEQLEKKYDARIFEIYRNKEFILPKADLSLLKNDRLVLIANVSTFNKIDREI